MLKSIARPVFRALPSPLQASLRNLRPDPAIAAFADAGIEVPERDFNNLLHYLRGEELARLPQQAPCFISVGCAGTWYFNWVQEKCAPQRHIGIEYYAPKPTDLPGNVEWIANTAGDMSGIASGTGDILFSGQNIEHLWPHDIGAFLSESHRVLKPGGLLVIDSPNRLVTSAQNWSHPEHILEFTSNEAAELISAAGFEVEAVRGMWLCSSKGKPLPFGQLSAARPWPMARRIADAIDTPADSFSWWIVARKADRSPDPQQVAALVDKAFKVAWPDRINRIQPNGPGEILVGPRMPLPQGSYSFGFDLKARASGPFATIEVRDGNDRVLASRTVSAQKLAGRVELTFEIPDTTFGIQYRVLGLNGAFECRRGVSLTASDSLFSAGRI